MVCADHCARLLNMNLPEVINDGNKLAQVLEYGLKTYQYDMVLVFTDPYVEAQALGCPVAFPSVFGNPILLGPQSNSPNVSCDRTSVIIQAAQLLKQRVDVPVFVSIKGPFTLASFLLGIEEFLKNLLQAEINIQEAIRVALEFQLDYLSRLLKIGVNIFIGDPMASVSVISPKIFQRFAFQPLKILINKIKSERRIVGLHICGNTKPIISILDELGADILSIEDITPKTKTLKMGGVATDTILVGNEAKLTKAVKKALNEPYLILATACDVPMETDSRNIKLMMEIARSI